MSIRLIVTGADGMLGRELVREAGVRGLECAGWNRSECDVTDPDAVQCAVDAARPNVVIHAGAWTDVDGCEADPARAFLVNGRGTANVARACREAGARLVMVSTDYVFSGDKDGPYVEHDAPGPLSVYGWSKLMGEEAVRTLGPAGIVARTAWVYADHGANFLRTMLRLGRDGPEIAVVDDQRGSPTFAADLATGLLDLAAAPAASGTFHVTNGGSTTWFGFATRILAQAAPGARVTPTTTDRFPRPAKRPENSVLGGRRLAEAGLNALPSWEDGLARCLSRLDGASGS